MRKLQSPLLLAVLLALAVNTAHARPTRKRNRRGTQHKRTDMPVKLGVKGGGGLSYLLGISPNAPTGDRSKKLSSPLFRPQVDLFGEHALSSPWGLQWGLAYLCQGGSYEVEQQGQRIALAFYSQYLLLSPSFRLYPGDDRQLCIFLGPQFSYMLSLRSAAYVNGNQQGNTENMLRNPNTRDRIRRFDLGVMLGLDYEFDFHLVIGSRGNFGFLSLFRNSSSAGPAAPNPPSLTNISGCLYVGYNFAPLLLQ